MSIIKNTYVEIEQLQIEAIEGNINELDAYIQLSDLEKKVKEVKEGLKDYALTQCRKYQEKSFVHSGRKIQIRNTKRWSYKHAKAWQKITEERKTLEMKMQAANLAGLDTDSETGETITPAQYVTVETIAIGS